ncbi:MAG: exodeoxyribonuclease VII small subunit [Marivirga sp.]|jgi:exodeoxyribonuclease VII small subunit
MAKKEKKSYETSMAELENLLNKVENEAIGIDELTEVVKSSVILIKDCKLQLQGIEKEVDKSLNDLTKE